MVDDFEIIFPEYEKNFNNSFFKDYKELDVIMFNLKISSLENNFKHLTEARDILINNRKVDKSKRKWAEQFMTEEIKQYRQSKMEESKKKQFAQEIQVIDNVLKEIINRRDPKNKGGR